MVEFNQILEFIKYVLKILIYFDNKFVYLQKGGGDAKSGANSKTAANSKGDKKEGEKKDGKKEENKDGKKEEKKDGKKDEKKKEGEGANNKGDSDNKESNSENNDEDAENAGSAGFLWILTYLKEIIMGVLSFFGSKAMSLASMLLFASTAPIIPFFIAMAGMFGVLKYFMFKLRRL